MASQVGLNPETRRTIERLRNLPKEFSGKNGGPIRQALFQAAKVIETEARLRAGKIDRPETESSIPKAIKKWRDRNPRRYPGKPVEVYHVGVDGRKAPHWHFLELGTVKQPAQPYLRPAFEMQKEAAVARFEAVLAKAVTQLERKVAKLQAQGEP